MRNTVHCIACFFLTMVVMGTVPCHAAVYGDALYSSVLSAIPGITFVTSTPSMSNDTSVYFSSFGWPADRVAQQADYVSVPVAVMSLCLAVQTTGAVNATTAPTMTDIGDLLLGKSTGAWWLRSDWTSTRRVTKVYLASSSLPPVLNALNGWYGAPFTANTDLSSLGSTVSILPTDADVTNALANDPSAIAFVPFIATAQSKMVCLSITSVPGSSYMIPPTAVWTYSMKINVTTLNVTCVPGYGCYPFVGALVAHVRKRSSVAACDSSTSLLPVIYNFTSPSSPIFVPLGRWSIQLPTTATILAVLQTLISSVCMPETRVLVGVGSDAVNSVLRDWGYQYFMESNGTAFVTYNTVSTPEAALEAVDARVADFAAGPALNASDRAAFPALHSFPSSAFTVSIIANAAQSGQLVLPRCSITSIFNGTIRWWNDTAIQAVNSVALMPQKLIDVTVRVDPSRTTDIFMAGLRALDMECFGTTSIPPTATLPSFVRATQFTGNDAVAIYVATTPYTISWLPTSYFSSYYFVEVSIQADDGSLTNSADVQKMLQSGTLDPETTDLTLSNVTKHPFPFVALSSLIVPLDTEGFCDRTKSNVEFIVWALSSATALNYIYYDFFFALPTSVLSSCVQYFTHTVRCDGALLYPPPPTPLLWWPIALVGGLILVAAVVGIRWRYWQLVYGVRPTDPSSAIAVMFVGVKNQAAVQEAGEENVMAVCRLVADTTRRMARKHRCYEARRVDAWTTMIVAKSAQAAVACAEDVVLTLSVGVQWLDDVLRHPMPIQPVLDLHDRKSSASIPLSKRSGRSSRVRGADGSSRRGGVASSQTHRTGSTPTQLTIQNCVPQIYAGVHWTHVMMDDSQGDSVSYYGAGIGAAGGVADLAVDGQVLVSREVACEIDSKHPEQVDYSFTPLTTASGDVTALALTTPRFPTWLLERTALRRKSLEEKGADSGGGTTILAALASADGALAKRRIAVVSLLMRDMVNEGVDGRGDVVRDALETLRDIVTAHRGEILSIMDGVVTVTIGASGPVAMAAVRATQIAMDASDLCIAAGIHSGPALVGNAMGGKPATNGRVVTGASLMRLVAARANVPIVASDAVHGDLSARFQLSTVDLVAAPWDLKKQVRCYAVVEERSDTGDNEWLYVLQDGFAPLERRLDDCLRGKALAADEPANPSEPSLASRFFDRHQEYFALSNDLYNGVQAARERIAGFLVNRLIAVMVGVHSTTTL